MHTEIKLPQSNYIDITLGLKYLNGNKKLYLKVLNSFLERYKDLDVNALNTEQLKESMHTMKGLSSTLGMVLLSQLASSLYGLPTKQLLLEFSQTLKSILEDLDKAQTKTVLIVESDSDNLDILVDTLDNNYDIIVATTKSEALESILCEKIHLILLNKEITDLSINKKETAIIYLTQTLNMDKLIIDIEGIFNENYPIAKSAL